MPKIKRVDDAAARAKYDAAQAGGDRGVCAVVAIHELTGAPIEDVAAALEAEGREKGSGTHDYQMVRALKRLGFEATGWSIKRRLQKPRDYPGVHSRLRGITTHHWRRFPKAWAEEPPLLLVITRSHALAVVNGEVKDWSINRSLRVESIYTVERIEE